MSTTQILILAGGAVALAVIWTVTLLGARQPAPAPAKLWPPQYFHPEWLTLADHDDEEDTGKIAIPVRPPAAPAEAEPDGTMAMYIPRGVPVSDANDPKKMLEVQKGAHPPEAGAPAKPFTGEESTSKLPNIRRGIKVTDVTNPLPFNDEEPTNLHRPPGPNDETPTAKLPPKPGQ